jgi:NADH:ubiquinone oxidoreductase subunit K
MTACWPSAALSLLAQAAPRAASADQVGLTHYLVVSALVFALGVMIIIVRRNAIALLMGLELLLNSAGLNFVAFAKYASPDRIDGQVMTLFIIVIAAAEASLALAITLNIFNRLNTVEVDEARSLQG